MGAINRKIDRCSEGTCKIKHEILSCMFHWSFILFPPIFTWQGPLTLTVAVSNFLLNGNRIKTGNTDQVNMLSNKLSGQIEKAFGA